MATKKVIEVDDETEEIIHGMCRKTGLQESDVIRKLANLQGQRPEPEIRREERGKDIIDKVIDLEAIGRVKGRKDENEGGLIDKETLKMMLQMQYLQQLFPQQQQQKTQEGMGLKDVVELAKLFSGDGKKGEGDMEGLMKVFMEYQKTQDENRREDERERTKHLEGLLREKEIGELKGEIQKVQEAAKEKEEEGKSEIQERLDQLQALVLNLENRDDPLTKKVEIKLKEKLTDALVNAVSDFDITNKKESLTTDEGKVNVNKLVSEGLNVINRGIDAYAKGRPQPQDIREMTTEQITPQGHIPGVGDSIKIRPQVEPQPQIQPQPQAQVDSKQEILAPKSQTQNVVPNPEEQPKEEKETKLQRKRREKMERVRGE